MSSFVTMTKKRMKSVQKYVCQFRRSDPMCCAVLSSYVSEYEVHLCHVLEGTSAHLMMFCILHFSTMVLLEDLDRHFS